MNTTNLPFPLCQRIFEDPGVVGQNKLPYRFPDFTREEEQCLDGNWKFQYCPGLCLPDGFEQEDFPETGMDTMPVPGNWQLHGFSIPKYINTRYPFEPEFERLHPPFVPDEQNSAGIYRTRFTCHPRMKRRVILSLDGVSSAAFVWMNGQYAGYSANGRTAAEFDITAFVREGENQLTVLVLEFAAGSFLEDQDMWRLSGLHRSVRVYQIPEVCLFDVFAWSQSDACGDAELFLECKIMNFGEEVAAPRGVKARLENPDGSVLAQGEGWCGNCSSRFQEITIDTQPQPILPNTLRTAYLRLEVPAPMRWTEETPVLYRIVLETTGDGVQPQQTSLQFGFRDVKVEKGVLLVNSHPVKIKGVNRHEVSPENGQVITFEEMERDLALMKQNNINGVRCSHYPNHPHWYSLCDEVGMYVMDEANIESHGISYRRNLLPGNDFRWMPMVLDRIQAMVQVQKNHPSILCWSLGNELGFGETVAAAAAFCRALDPTRLIHKRQMNSIADMDSENYQTPSQIQARLDAHPDRSFLSAEYGHAMGNAVGNLKEYWDLYWHHPRAMGGFIWEWCDHGLWKDLPDGSRFLSYGGDWGEAFHDRNFCIDGLVSPLRTQSSKLDALKQVQAPVEVTIDQTGRLLHIRNRRFHTGLSDLYGEAVVTVNGREKQKAAFDLPSLLPGESGTVTSPLPALLPEEMGETGEILLTVRILRKWDSFGCQAGDWVSFSQKLLRRQKPLPIRQENLPALYELSEPDFSVENENIRVTVDKHGKISAFSHGKPLFLDLYPLFYRAPLDNDRPASWCSGECSWESCGLNTAGYRLIGRKVERIGSGYLRLSMQTRTEGKDCGFDHRMILDILGDGRLYLLWEGEPFGDMPVLGRIGLTAVLPQQLDTVRWYGCGPRESYPDRKEGEAIGEYELAVDGMEPYLRPQEYGARMDCRWMLVDGESPLFTAGAAPYLMNILPYTPVELAETAHLHELPRHRERFLYLDYLQTGVGNRSCGAETLPSYRLTPHAMRMGVMLAPFQPVEMEFPKEWEGMDFTPFFGKESFRSNEDESCFLKMG